MNETTPAPAAPAASVPAVPRTDTPGGKGPRPAAASEPGTRARVAELLQRQGVLAVLLTVVIAASFIYPTFASLDNARGITIQASFLAVVALGMTMVIITGGIDLSVGSVFALGESSPPGPRSTVSSPPCSSPSWHAARSDCSTAS